MLKRLTVAVAALFALCLPVFAAGTLPGFSLTPQFDLTGKVAPNCFLYVIQAGTVSTPQQPYQDSGLTLISPNPLTCDASGRLPQWFVADGTIKVRLTKSDGTQIFVGDNLLVVGASSGGGGGSPVDATTVLATGDVKVRYDTSIISGFVRLNGRSIGSASSGATERANADAQALFVFLWSTDPLLTVTGGRGVSAAADWAANKTLVLPDMRGRLMTGLDDMGSTAAGRLGTCTLPTTLGSGCSVGSSSVALTQANLPNVTLPNTLGISNTLGLSNTLGASIGTLATSSTLGVSNGTLGISSTLGVSSSLALNDPGHSHQQQNASSKIGTFTGNGALGWSNPNSNTATSSDTTGITLTGGVSLTGSVSLSGASSLTGGVSLTGSPALTGAISLTGSTTITGSITSGGSGTPVSVLAPTLLFTIYVKL